MPFVGTRIVISDEILLAVRLTLLGDFIESQVFLQISHGVRRKRLVGRSSGARYNISLKITQIESLRASLQSLSRAEYVHIGHAKSALPNDYLMNTLVPRRYEFLICQLDGTNPSKESAVQNSIPQDYNLLKIQSQNILFCRLLVGDM